MLIEQLETIKTIQLLIYDEESVFEGPGKLVGEKEIKRTYKSTPIELRNEKRSWKSKKFI